MLVGSYYVDVPLAHNPVFPEIFLSKFNELVKLIEGAQGIQGPQGIQGIN